MAMIVCKEKHLPELKTKLEAKGIACEIQIIFGKYKFTSAKYTAVLHSHMLF